MVVITSPQFVIQCLRKNTSFSLMSASFRYQEFFFQPVLFDHGINPVQTDCLKELGTS